MYLSHAYCYYNPFIKHRCRHEDHEWNNHGYQEMITWDIRGKWHTLDIKALQTIDYVDLSIPNNPLERKWNYQMQFFSTRSTFVSFECTPIIHNRFDMFTSFDV